MFFDSANGNAQARGNIFMTQGSVEVVCWSVVLVLGSGASSTSTKWVASGFSATDLRAAGVPGLIVVQCGCSDEVNRME